MKREDATKIANETQNSYDLMAREFSDSRARFWDELSFLAQHIERDDHVLDIGCGNGRFMPLVSERHAQYAGIDYSQGLINEAKRISPEGDFHVADATALPFEDNNFDIAYSFAVIHHIPSAEGRRKFATEALRVLHPGGKLVLTAWNLWSQKYFFKLLRCDGDVLKPENYRHRDCPHPRHGRRAPFPTIRWVRRRENTRHPPRPRQSMSDRDVARAARLAHKVARRRSA